jgi:hypothetical protein
LLLFLSLRMLSEIAGRRLTGQLAETRVGFSAIRNCRAAVVEPMGHK